MRKFLRYSWLLVLPMVAAAAVIWKASAAEPSERQCPQVDPPWGTVVIPNPADCSTFFSCSNGVAILMRCPDGLYFNDKLDVCDWPRNVDTKDCAKPEGEEEEEDEFKYKIVKDQCSVKVTAELIAKGKVQNAAAKLGLLPTIGVTLDLTSLTCLYVLADPDEQGVRLGDDVRCSDLF